MCPGLQLWEDDYTIILVAQLASPITNMNAVQDLTEALFHWMDSELLLFLRDHIDRPTLGQYAYLQAAQTPETRAQRMRAMESAPSHFCSDLYQRISLKARRAARHCEA